jgi:hypothetical protein
MTMQAKVLQDTDVSYLDRVLLKRDGSFAALPASTVKAYPHEHVQIWCHKKARYNIPTEEQILFLKTEIGERSAIEIGAGMGDLGGLLGIPMTDSYIQTTVEMQLYYKSLGQPTITPPPTVEKLDAVQAITKYKPQVVVASWVTQLYRDGDSENNVGACISGVDEEWTLDHCDTYIFIGNEAVHKDKRILKHLHRTCKPHWLVSRAYDQSKNVIWIWGK